MFKDALSFDDVLLEPGYSEVLPSDVCTKTKITPTIELNIPILASAMDTVTEARMAIVMAQNGGIGVVHRNLSTEEQANEIRKVKRYESGVITNPITVSPEAELSVVLDAMKKEAISGLPVVEEDGSLVGILTNRDIRFVDDITCKVSDLMTMNLVTACPNISLDEAKLLLHKHRIEKLLLVDDGRLAGLITVKDIEKTIAYPNAAKDLNGRLRAGAAIGSGESAIERAQELISAGVDVIVVDTAHGHSKGVLDTVTAIKKLAGCPSVIGGNIVTGQAALALVDAGVDAVKVGVGPGSICTTRIVTGVGSPQLSAILNITEMKDKTTRARTLNVIADGGIRSSGDIAKAIAAGADAVMIGNLLAGTEESPGEKYVYQGRVYKAYRGMGSLGAMTKGSADRYFQAGVTENKLVPEGIEGQVPYRGSATDILHFLIGGLRSSMGYTGNVDIHEMQLRNSFVRVTNAGVRESHVHDVDITKDVPNYVR